MSKIKNGALDQYGAEPFEQQQFGTAGVEGVKMHVHDTGKFYITAADSDISAVLLTEHLTQLVSYFRKRASPLSARTKL